MLFPLKPEKFRATLSAGWCILPNWAVPVCDLSKRAKRSWTTSSEEFFSLSFVVGEIMWNPHLLVFQTCQNMLRHVKTSTPSVGYNRDSRWSTHNSVGAVSKFYVSYHLPCFFFPSCWLVGSDPLHEQLWTPQIDDVRCILAHQPGRVEQTIPNVGE